MSDLVSPKDDGQFSTAPSPLTASKHPTDDTYLERMFAINHPEEIRTTIQNMAVHWRGMVVPPEKFRSAYALLGGDGDVDPNTQPEDIKSPEELKRIKRGRNRRRKRLLRKIMKAEAILKEPAEVSLTRTMKPYLHAFVKRLQQKLPEPSPTTMPQPGLTD